MALSEIALAMVYALAGTLVAALCSLIPALHVYNVAGLVVLLALRSRWLDLDAMAFLFVGLVVGYAVLSTIQCVFLAVPDDASAFVVLPGQKYTRQGRGYEAVALTGIGSLGGILLLALLAAVAHPLIRVAREVIRPHLHWVLWAVIAWMLQSEWPKGADRAPSGWRRWWEAWSSLTAGLITFLLSGLLGIILFYRNPVPVESAYQGLLPAFVGLFAVPWVLLNVVSTARMPNQYVASTVDVTAWQVVVGIVTGLLGGLFSAFLPGVTGGIGGLIAGHATAQRDDRTFLVSQGASKATYYLGALLLLFVPGLNLTRGGMAAILGSVWGASTFQVFYAAIGAALVAGVAAFLMLLSMARLTARLVGTIDYRKISTLALAVLVVVVQLTTGWKGLIVCGAATGIGLLPTLWGSRRVNCMGVILLPLALELAGVGGVVAGWLGMLP